MRVAGKVCAGTEIIPARHRGKTGYAAWSQI
jgi:hypothetical protein